MDEKEVQQEFDLEDILREFGDSEEDVQEKTPEEILNAAEEEALKEYTPEVQLRQEATPAPVVPDGGTIRFEPVTSVKGTVRNAQPILDEEEEVEPAPAEPEVSTEPYSEEWEPEYEQPIAEYVPPNPIPFRPRSRLRELKKKLVEGPEKLYYDMMEKGVGKLQLALAVSLLLVLVCAGATALYGFGLVPDHRMRLMVFLQFWAMLVSALLGSFQLIEGVSDLFHKRFSLNTMLVFTFLLCCVDGILCLKQLRVPCCAAFSLQVLMSLWSAYQKRTVSMGQLDTMRKATRLDSLTVVEDYHEEGCGILRGEGRVEDFMETLDDSCGPEKAISIYAIVAVCLSIAAGITTGVLHGVGTGIQVAAVSTLAALPATMFITLSRPAAILERRLHKLGTVLCGWQGVKGLSRKALFPLDHPDILPVSGIKLNGVKFFGSRQPDEVVAYATALISKNGGSLEHLFNHLLDSRNGMHYGVGSFRHYDGGIGGEVNGEPVMVGNIRFLESMGVEIPAGVQLQQAVCVAVDGELCGLFAIAYDKDPAIAAGIGTLCSYGKLKTVVTTDDFIITEELITERFSVRSRKVLFPDHETRAALREKAPEQDQRAQALVTREGLAPFAYAVTGARALKSACNAGVLFHIIGGGLGIAMVVLLGVLGATYLLTPVSMFLYELVLLIPGILITEWTRPI